MLLAGSAWARTASCAPPDSAPAADSGPAPMAAPAPAEWRWYGWQILLSDVGSLTELAVAETLASGSAPSGNRDAGVVVFALSVSQFVLGGAIVHASHRQWARAGLSIGERLLLPATGFVLGLALAPPARGDEVSDAFPLAAMGLLAGMAAAHVVDAAVLSTIPPPTSERAPANAAGMAWMPVVLVAPDARDRAAGIIGVSGSF
jgi:hypothetical protein